MSLSSKTSSPVLTSGEIRFSELRKQFKTVKPRSSYDDSSDDYSGDSNSISISSSELLRITDLSVSNPLVGNSEENLNISTTYDWKTSQFRNSIKYYFVRQTGTDTDIDGDVDISWNTNLNKTINKLFFVEGTIGATSTLNSAIKFDSSVTNLNIIIKPNGEVLRAGGTNGTVQSPIGGDGGNAISFTSTANSIIIDVNSGGALKSGGGGGGLGGNGNYTATVYGFGHFYSNYSTTLNDGGQASCNGATNKPSPGDFTYMGCGSVDGNGYCSLCSYSPITYDPNAIQKGSEGGKGQGYQQDRTLGTSPASNNSGVGGQGGLYGENGFDGADGLNVNGTANFDGSGYNGGLKGYSVFAPTNSYTIIKSGTVLGREG